MMILVTIAMSEKDDSEDSDDDDDDDDSDDDNSNGDKDDDNNDQTPPSNPNTRSTRARPNLFNPATTETKNSSRQVVLEYCWSIAPMGSVQVHGYAYRRMEVQVHIQRIDQLCKHSRAMHSKDECNRFHEWIQDSTRDNKINLPQERAQI